MATYIALTTTNPANGSRPVTHGPDRHAVETLARQIIAPDGVPPDIYAQTELRNLVVVPASRVRGNARRKLDHALDTIQEVAAVVGCQTPHLRALSVLANGGENADGDRAIEREPAELRALAPAAAFALRRLDVDAPASISGDWRGAARAFVRELSLSGHSVNSTLADYLGAS